MTGFSGGGENRKEGHSGECVPAQTGAALINGQDP